MPYAFHHDPQVKWQQQYLAAKNHILPFIKRYFTLPPAATLLEIGCGEGGVLKAFSETGFICHGIDLAASRIEQAGRLFAEEIETAKVTFYAGDIHDLDLLAHLRHQIDLIILKDAIEHIPDQERILGALHGFLKKDGSVFLAFPPWCNPFGGHQQLARSFLRFMPWIHLFPQSLYRRILQLCGETETQIHVLMQIYETRISTRRFESLLQRTGWQIVQRQFYLLNPIYEYKFGIKGRRQLGLISAIPVMRDFVSTGVYYLITAR